MTEAFKEHGADGDERRNERRRRVLFFSKITDATGAQVGECAIRSLSAAGAQVRLYTDHSFPSLVYLIDARTNCAYLAEVMWRKADCLGLGFRETLDLKTEIPERLTFLKRLLTETKVRQVDLLEAKGFTLDEALEAIGATRTAYERWRRDELISEGTRATIERLMLENANALKLLAHLPDN